MNFEISPKKHGLHFSELFLEILMNTSDVIFICVLDEERRPIRFVDVNDAACRLLGYEKNEFMELLPVWLDGGEIPAYKGEPVVVNELSRNVAFKRYLKSKAGKSIPFEICGSYENMNGQKIGVAICRNISEYLEHQKILEESEERYRQLVELSPDAILIHTNETIAYANDAAIKLLKIKNIEELMDKPLLKFVHKSQQDLIRRHIDYIYEKKATITTYERKVRLYDGVERDVNIAAAYLLYKGMPSIQIVIRDITENKWNKMLVSYMSSYDTLTGLPNRAAFIKKVNGMVDTAQRCNKNLAIIHLDIDRFKSINDTLGHTVGDRLLVNISERLMYIVKEKHMVARTGGDEFNILIGGYKKIEEVKNIVQKIVNDMRKPFFIDGYELYVTVSAGISQYPQNGSDVEKLLKYSHIAMYRSKSTGGDNFQFYSDEMNTKTPNHLRLVSNLKRAIDNDELVMFYQPQYCLVTGRIVGTEALVRWQHRELGLIPPGEFISIAEETGLILPMGEWVLDTVCKQAKAWQDAGLSAVRVAVNLSPRQLLQDEVYDVIFNIIKRTSINPSLLELEITESSFINNIDEVNKILERLRCLGVTISMDDFGTGYSSLNYLKKINIDYLKIDKSFINDITTDKSNLAIATAIINMAHALDLKVIAEGVETYEQLAILKRLRCDFVQGYLLSRPLPKEEFEKLLSKNNIFNM